MAKDECDANRAGLAVGIFLAAVHFLWLIVVFLGWGQKLLDFVFSLHMLTNPFTVMPAGLGRAIGLLVMTFVVGYVIGWFVVKKWNWLGKKR